MTIKTGIIGCGVVGKKRKKYIIENKDLKIIDKKKLRMLSTNFCNGGQEINEIDKTKI